MNKQSITYNIIVSIIGMFIGLIVCVIDPQTLLNFIFVVLGIIIILFALPGLIHHSSYDKNEKYQIMITSIISIIVGAILIFYPQTVALIIAGLFLIAIPIYRIVSSKNHYETFKKELVRLIIGTVVIVFGIGSTLKVILYIVGGLIILVSLIYMIYNIVLLIKLNKLEKKEQEDNEVIDV